MQSRNIFRGYKVFHRQSHCFSHSDFNIDFNNFHIPTSNFQKLLLTIGASTVSILDPSRGDMIATLGETTGYSALKYIRAQMEQSEEGADILRVRPRINSTTVDMKYLANLPEETVGNVYYKFLLKNKVTPDSRAPVQFVDDLELAYVMQRYREVHDLIHAILYMPTNMLGEVTVKWVEGIQTRLPMCITGGLFGAVRLAPKQRKKYTTTHLPWAIRTGMTSNFMMNIFFEKRWEQPISQLHEELNIIPLIK
uniref:Ubiquinone biosynthesis protein COQ4 homolog, mitochondrial n=3 Tax=Rhodnius TaxID=13248 RepID=R4G893_RHOPR